ncbi:unnamed protein product, partial [Ilex paraguariensis]
HSSDQEVKKCTNTLIRAFRLPTTQNQRALPKPSHSSSNQEDRFGSVASRKNALSSSSNHTATVFSDEEDQCDEDQSDEED